jgi:[acyl-carrier-protein] S-malonyltransferase
MFGTAEELKETKATSCFFYIGYISKNLGDDFKPEMVAGHSLRIFSFANGTLSFEDG